MDAIFVICSAIVALVFVVAGISKLGDKRVTANSLLEFGVPQALVGPSAAALPYVELAVAALLLWPGLAWAGAIGALLLLLSFTAFVVLSLLRGQRPSCNCFGQVRSAPITWHTALRNGLLTAMAVVVLWAGEGRLDQGLLAQAAALAGAVGTTALGWSVLGLAIALQLWINLKLLGQQGRLLLKVDNLEHRISGGAAVNVDTPFAPGRGLPLGEPLPSFSATTLRGQSVSAADLLRDKAPLFLLFVGAECAPCKELASDLAAWRASNRPDDRLVVISSGSREANQAKLSPALGMDLLLQTGFELNDLFGVVATPSAMLIDRAGKVRSGLAVGHEPIISLASLSVAPQAPAAPRLSPVH